MVRASLMTGAIVVYFLANNSHVTAAEPQWTKYTNKEAGFEAEFPSKDVVVEKKAYGTHFNASIPGMETDFRVVLTRGVEKRATFEAARKELRRIRDASIPKNAELLSSKDLTVSGHPAIEFHWKGKVDTTIAIFSFRFVLVQDILYQQLTVSPIGENFDKEKERFFQSLSFNPVASPTVAAAAPGAGKVNWTKYSSKSGHFSVEFPTKDVEAKVVGGTITRYASAIAGDPRQFMLYLERLPPHLSTPRAIRLEMIRRRDALVADKKFELGLSKDTSVQSHPAMEFVVKHKQLGRTTFRYVVANGMFYRQLITNLPENGPSNEAEKFFGSLNLAQ